MITNSRSKTIPLKKEKNQWRLAWAQPVFGNKVGIAFALNIPVLILFPVFFRYIEKRNGIQL
jgi:hypothetical protein